MALPTARSLELIDNHKFVKVALDKIFKIFVVYISTLEIPKPAIYLFQVFLLTAL